VRSISLCAEQLIWDHQLSAWYVDELNATFRPETECDAETWTIHRHIIRVSDGAKLISQLEPMRPDDALHGSYAGLQWFTFNIREWRPQTPAMWEDEVVIARIDPSLVEGELLVGCRPHLLQTKTVYVHEGHTIEIQCADRRGSVTASVSHATPDARL
jgi:hypothetical protein